LAVVRHQAKVAADRQRSNTEPVAGTSAGTAAKTASCDEIQRGRRTVGKKSRGQAGGQAGSNSLSQAQLNVVRTMVYITVCFTLCWMPMYLYIMTKRMIVRMAQ